MKNHFFNTENIFKMAFFMSDKCAKLPRDFLFFPMVAKASHQTKKFEHTGPKLREHGVGKMRQKSLNRYNFNQKAKI